MIHSNLLIPILHISKLFKLPSDITHLIYFYIINNSAQIIIDKWYSFIYIHNTNLCYIVNKIPILQDLNSSGNLITYYNLHDKKLSITLSICAKYIKYSISDKTWWSNFIENGFNGINFIHNYMDPIVQNNILYLTHILGCFQ